MAGKVHSSKFSKASSSSPIRKTHSKVQAKKSATKVHSKTSMGMHICQQ